MTCPKSLAANHEAILKTGALQEPAAALQSSGCVGSDCATNGEILQSAPASQAKAANTGRS